MTKKQRVLAVIERLKKEYPEASCTLAYEDAWQLLVSVRLAAQCTDARVDQITPLLYEKFPSVAALAAAGVEPNVRFYTKDDYAILAMVDQGLGMSIMPELLLKGQRYDLQILPLVPESKRTIGLAIAAGDKAGPATRRFADYVVRYVTRLAG